MQIPFKRHSVRTSILLACGMMAATSSIAEDLGTISITATREERLTAEVPQAIAVIGKEEIDEKKMFNMKEALQGVPGVLIDSKNGGFDARLIIRGAGLKAPYGIREIMVLRDGVPLTDPDSFTRLDFIDTQDIERIEIAKGPGNLFATGSTGGAVQIFSRSVFDKTANNFKIGVGNDGTRNYHLRYGEVGEEQALALTTTYRTMDNDWRKWNEFSTNTTSIKHGWLTASGDALETEISYSEADMQLPGSMDKAMFEEFVSTGKQTDTADAWKHSGRYSKVWFFNTKYEMERGDVTFKPRMYFNTWYHYHPVTGIINETEDWVRNIGTDLELHYKHGNGVLVGGLTVREERVPDSRKYEYRDVVYSGGRIVSTLSDAKGDLASVSDATSFMTGVYAQESWRPGDRWIVDFGMRYDVAKLTDKTNEITAYDYASGRYVAGAGYVETNKTFYLPAPKVAVNYKLTDKLNLFAMVSQAGQIPSSGEISSNPGLDAPVSRNYEVGVKGRAENWQFDASVYVNTVKDEIIQINNGGYTEYYNAGETDKKGLEFSGSYALSGNWDVGAYYAYSDYTFGSFSEPVTTCAFVPPSYVCNTVNVSRDGNALPFVPKHQYGASLGWRSHDGWKARLTSNSWGEYWMDNANTEKYEGWRWITNLSVGYETSAHSLMLNVDNMFDEHYAAEVKKDTRGTVRYTAAAPRSWLLTYRYNFQ